MTFNVQKGPFKFQKVSLTCEGGHPSPTPSPTPPRLVASLPHFVPPPPLPLKKIWPRQCYQITLGAMKIYVISRGARSLIIIIIWNGMLKARYYNFALLAIWRKLLHTSNPMHMIVNYPYW